MSFFADICLFLYLNKVEIFKSVIMVYAVLLACYVVWNFWKAVRYVFDN